MMPLSRLLAPLLAAAFAAACGISSVSDDGTPKLGVAEAPAQAFFCRSGKACCLPGCGS